jgi:hypothetical protein
VIGSAIVPTMIAQKFFRPEIDPAVALEVVSLEDVGNAPGTDGAVPVRSGPVPRPEET